MADQLNQVLSFANVLPGNSLTVAHNINVAGRRFVPDLIMRDNLAFTITAATTTDITARNDGGAIATLNTWLQLQHSLDRAYGGVQNTALAPNPFVPGGLQTTNSPIWTPLAIAHLDSGTGLYTVTRGFVGAGPVKNGVGDWTLEYTPAFNTDVGSVLLTVQDQGGAAAQLSISAQTVDNTHVRVRTFRGGAATDQHFWIQINRIV